MSTRSLLLGATVAVMLLSGCQGGQTGTGTQASTAPAAQSTSAPGDIVRAGDGALLGSGWYALENAGGTLFRWADNNAEITACPDANNRTVAIYMEPGPAAGKKPLPVTVIGNRGDRTQTTLRGRQYVKVNVAQSAPAETFAIHVVSPNLPTPHDPRTLNYRAFSVLIGSSAADCKKAIINDGSPISLGANWYPYETFGGQSFRWVNNDAKIKLDAAQRQPFTLEASVEPGPSLGGAPLVITVRDERGNTLSKSQATPGRAYVTMTLPAAPAGTTYTLHVQSKNTPVPGDKRTLNFRVFNLKIRPPVA